MRSPKFLHHSTITYLGPLSNYTEDASLSVSNYIIFLWPFLSAASAILWPHFISGNYLLPALSSFSRFQLARCHLPLPKPQRRCGLFAQSPSCSTELLAVPEPAAPVPIGYHVQETLGAARSPSPVHWPEVLSWDVQGPSSAFMKSLTQAQNFSDRCLTNTVMLKTTPMPHLIWSHTSINLHILGFYGEAFS